MKYEAVTLSGAAFQPTYSSKMGPQTTVAQGGNDIGRWYALSHLPFSVFARRY